MQAVGPGSVNAAVKSIAIATRILQDTVLMEVSIAQAFVPLVIYVYSVYAKSNWL